MYWYKLPKQNIILKTCICFALLSGCKPEVRQNGSPQFFDLKKYFDSEAIRLGKKNMPIIKTVKYNNQPEKKPVIIKKWRRELALFIESDINKPSWRDSYKVIDNKDSVVYTAIDTSLRTRYVSIRLNAAKVSSVQIVNFTKNLLYQTQEKLIYYPDSVYQIEKKQSVKILGTNNYLITGKFK